MQKRRSSVVVVVLVGAGLLAACGQKGPLVLPAHAGAASAPRSAGSASGPLVEPPPAVLR